MERLILTFGMRKSASTYAFQLTRDLFRRYSSAFAQEEEYPDDIQHPFVPTVDYLARVLRETPPGRIGVRKTHLGLDDRIRRVVDNGDCFAVVQVRDPLDIVASLIDAGKRERQKPPELQREGFCVIHDVADTLPILQQDILIAQEWIEFAIARNTPCVDYEFVTEQPIAYLEMVARHFGLAGDFEALVEYYQRDASQIMEFNRGEIGRGRQYATALEACGMNDEIRAFQEFLRQRASEAPCRFGRWITAGSA